MQIPEPNSSKSEMIKTLQHAFKSNQKWTVTKKKKKGAVNNSGSWLKIEKKLNVYTKLESMQYYLTDNNNKNIYNHIYETHTKTSFL